MAGQTLLVVGAAGRLGRALVHEAVTDGWRVRALSRSAGSAGFPPGVRPIAGDARDRDEIADAMAGADAVLMAANVQRAAEWNPWSPIVNGLDVVQRATANVLAADPGVRIVSCSAHGVGDSYDRSGFWFRAMIDRTSIHWPYQDHAVAEALLRDSHAAWTVVRPVILTHGPTTGRVQVGDDLRPGSFAQVSRGDVARWMVEELTARRWVGRAVTLTGV